MSVAATRQRADLAEGLRSRRLEIEQAALTRVYAISDPKEIPDPEYMEGLRAAVANALEHAFAALARSEDNPPPIPTAILSQARLAVRNGVGLDTVLRRYFAGYTLLGDFVLEEAERGGHPHGAGLQHLLRRQAALFDRLVAAVSEEYRREQWGRPTGTEQRRTALVKRLLAGELRDASGLGYGLGDWHLGAIVLGPEGAEAIRGVAGRLDCRLLLVHPREDIVWAWLGGRRKLDPEAVRSALSSDPSGDLVMASGEPGEGISGWRLSHRQAKATLTIAVRGPSNFVRYSDVALAVSMLADDLLVTSLREQYLAPLEREGDGGRAVLETLRAYFASECKVSSAAAALGVSRQSVGRRLRIAEERLGQPLNRCGRELEAALCLASYEVSLEPPSTNLLATDVLSVRPFR